MPNAREFSVEAFSKAVEAIYDCALEPERWRETILQILDLLHSPRGGLFIRDLAVQRTERAFDHGYDDAYVKLFVEKYARMDPVTAALPTLQVGEVATLAMLVDEQEFLESRIYREFLSHHGLRDTITSMVLRSGQRVAMLFCNRHDDQPRYDAQDVRILGLLAPHVCRSLAISDALDLRTLSSQMLEATLNGLSVGVYLVARDHRIVHMNRAAQRQVQTSGTLRIINHRLTPTNEVAGAALSKAIADAIADENRVPDSGYALAIPGPEERHLVATVLPLDRGERRGVFQPFAAAVAVFVQDPAVVPQFPGEAFAKLYGLTSGELRVLLAMAPGLGVKEAGDMLGISEATAKTHLQRIFSKTGTSKQTELLNLLRASTPPVKRA